MSDGFLFDDNIVLDNTTLAILNAEESKYFGSVAGVQSNPQPTPTQPTSPPVKRQRAYGDGGWKHPLQGPGIEVENSYRGIKICRSRTVSMRTCRISHLRVMGVWYVLSWISPRSGLESHPFCGCQERAGSVRLGVRCLVSFSSFPLHPYLANGTRVSTRTDHLRSLRNRPTHHFRTLSTALAALTDHNTNNSTSNNNFPIPKSGTGPVPPLPNRPQDFGLGRNVDVHTFEPYWWQHFG